MSCYGAGGGTHHYACACREEMLADEKYMLEQALIELVDWNHYQKLVGDREWWECDGAFCLEARIALGLA